MSTPERLMGVGVEAETAKRTAWFTQSVGGAVTVQGPGNQFIIVSAAGTSLVLTNFDLGDEVTVVAKGNAVSVYPGGGDAIYPTSAGVARSLTADVARTYIKGEAGVFYAIATA